MNRQARLKRQRQRQRRIFLCLVGTLLLTVAGWNLLQTPPSYSWLTLDQSLFNPDMVGHPIADAKDQLRPMPLAEKDTALEQKINAILAEYPETLKPTLFYYNLQNQRYVSLGGDTPMPAASVIKLPLLLAYLREVDKGTLTPLTHLVYEDFEQAGGSGSLQYKTPGQPLPAKDVARLMIQESDNTCTNMLVYALGGAQDANRIFETLGLRGTRINNWLPDLDGTNLVSMRDMAAVLYNFRQGDLLSAQSKADGLEILRGTHNRRLIPALLPPKTSVAHKTGDIGTSLGNAGLVTLPDGREYILAMQVVRPFNNYGAKEMIQRVSKAIYDDVAAKQPVVLAGQNTVAAPGG